MLPRSRRCVDAAAANKSLEPTGLSGKHSARMKSRMLATEARGSALRYVAQLM